MLSGILHCTIHWLYNYAFPVLLKILKNQYFLTAIYGWLQYMQYDEFFLQLIQLACPLPAVAMLLVSQFNKPNKNTLRKSKHFIKFWLSSSTKHFACLILGKNILTLLKCKHSNIRLKTFDFRPSLQISKPFKNLIFHMWNMKYDH